MGRPSIEIAIFSREECSLLLANRASLLEFGIPVRVFVDSETSPSEIAILEEAAVDYSIIENPYPSVAEGMLPEIFASVESEWVFIVQVDEWPSRKLVNDALFAVMEAQDHVNAIGVPRKWVRFGGKGQLQYSRLPRLLRGDYQWRIIRHRNVQLLPLIHTPGINLEKGKVMRLGRRSTLYHLDWIVHSEQVRKAKLSRYEELLPGSSTRFADYYLPERREWLHFFRTFSDPELEEVAGKFFESASGGSWV